MTLIQKLPLGMTLAACMLMSSCSQEDVQMAQPLNEQTKMGFNSARLGDELPKIPVTNGTTGNNSFASGWKKLVNTVPDDPQIYQTGTSSLTHLWGDQTLPWLKPLPLPAINGGNIVTFMRQRNVVNPAATVSSQVGTIIKNLKPGKKYAVTIFVASTITMINGAPTQYAPKVDVELTGVAGASQHTFFDLDGKEAEWVSKTIVFEAAATEVPVSVSCLTNSQFYNSGKFLHYAHVFVAQNAVTEVQ
jgi:hypothetical protein